MKNEKTSKILVIFISIILLFALLLRISYAIYQYNNNIMSIFADDIAYWDYAENILKQGIFVPDISLLKIDVIGPGLPLLMAFSFIIFSKSWLTLFIINSLLNTVTIFIIFLIAKEIYNLKIALISLFISSIYFLYFFYIPRAGKEIYICLIFILIIYLFIKYFNSTIKNSLPISISISILFSILIHIDERYFAYIFLFIIFFLLSNIRIKIRFLNILIFIWIIFVLMLPWLIRNYYIYDRPVILTTRTDKVIDIIFNTKTVKKNNFNTLILNSTQIDSIINGSKSTFSNGKEISQEQIESIKSGLIPHRFNKFESLIFSFYELWKPIHVINTYSTYGFRFEKKWSLKHNLSEGLTYGLLLLFSIPGIIFTFKNNKKIAIVFLILLIFHTLIHILFIPYTRNRYRLPVDFIVIILGSYGLYILYNVIKSKVVNIKNQNIKG